jgi:hypothetical protein
MRGTQEQVTSRKPFPAIRPGTLLWRWYRVFCRFMPGLLLYSDGTTFRPFRNTLHLTPYTLHLTTLKCRGKDGETM